MKIWTLIAVLAPALLGATASPVNISTVSRSANVVTVTCSAACNIAANQGFAITGVTDATFNINGTASTGSGTSFTFAQTGSNASSSAGSVLPAKQAVILTITPNDTGITISGVFWVTTTSGIATSAASAWSGASTAEKNAIAAGSIIEVPFNVTYGNGTTKAAIQADLQNQYTTRQARQTSASVQPGQFFGGFFDGFGWSF